MTPDAIKFLLVDDDDVNLLAFDALLRRDGLEILKARSGADALELLLVHDVALAVLDVQMPGMGGFELAELMRGAARTKHIPIIFVTAGAGDRQHVFKGYETGAVDFLFKPIEPHVLKGKADVFFELYREKWELSNALRLHEMFVGILGHDLRNPLNAVLTGAEVLSRTLTDEADLRMARRVTAAGQRMANMIEQLLDLTRARLAGGLGFLRVRKRLDVGSLVQRTYEELRDVYPGREIVVEEKGDCTTTGDADRLLQLFSNVIQNALHHGTGSCVSVQVEKHDPNIVVRVGNEGELPADLLPTIFDPFRRRAGLAPRSQGLGLGLYIARQIAVAHGGSIGAESDSGHTVVTVRIPHRLAEAPHQGLNGESRTVLIVDDDEHIRDSLREAFEDERYHVETAANGQEALTVLRHNASRPDVVILDLVMPVLDGWLVYQAMQSDMALADIPVIVSTSNPARAPSGVTVVPKPLKLARLLDTVADLWTEGQHAS